MPFKKGNVPHNIRPLEERFWEKVRVLEDDDCWLWLAYKVKRKEKYGRIKVGQDMPLAHRVSYELNIGPIPNGMQVLHKCDNPSCVNPNHLMLGTQKDNMQDCSQKGRIFASQKTHCPQGHEYSDENTYSYGNNRQCRICRREADLRYKQKHERHSGG